VDGQTVSTPGTKVDPETQRITLDGVAVVQPSERHYVALHKPLSCRLFPVPGKAAGEMTEYDFPYFANARVLALKGRASPRLFERLGG